MKYFVNADKRVASGHENYIEFQLPTATEEFWDDTSLYMTEATMSETGFGDFWCSCMQEDIVFDMASFTKEELTQMIDVAIKHEDAVVEVILELKKWVDTQLAESVIVNWAFDRTLARRREQREAYQVDSRFFEEVKAMHKRYKDAPLTEYAAVVQEDYEELLRKYNLPSCFFPSLLYESDKQE